MKANATFSGPYFAHGVIRTITAVFDRHTTQIIIGIAVLILAYDPIIWLINTWLDPSYDSKGLLVFIACAVLFGWSVSSPLIDNKPGKKRLAFLLIGLTALLRLVSQLMAINTIGALALIADVYAIAHLCGLNSRRRAIAPFWLAASFAFSLPLERIFQRTIGYGLQHLSADGACFMLGGLFENVMCNGVRIFLNNVDVLVDLPCSGARTILLLFLFFCLLASVIRPSLKMACFGGVIMISAGLVANVLRITVLAIGIAFPESFFNIDVMAEPWHSLIGLVMLALAGTALMAWARMSAHDSRYIKRSSNAENHGPSPVPIIHNVPDRIRHHGWWLEAPILIKIQKRSWRFPDFIQLGSNGKNLGLAFLFLASAVIIVSLPRHPVDIAKKVVSVPMPTYLAGHFVKPVPLTAREKSYFVKYGGAAKKAEYGPHNLLIVRTSSPLRHLHAPDECLRGLGMKVDYLGVRYAPVPTAIYKAVTPDGEAYLIDVTFMSDKGHVTTNVSEAVWHWINTPGSSWTAIQRISSVETSDRERQHFERAVIASLDLPISTSQSNLSLTKGKNDVRP